MLNKGKKSNNSLDSFNLYYRELIQLKNLGEKEQLALLEECQKGNLEAYHRVLEYNQRLVLSIVKRCFLKNSLLERLDLISEGTLGLIEAIKNYDSSRGSFSNYATMYIIRQINWAILDHSSAIRKSRKYHYALKKYQKIMNYCQMNHQDLPSDEEFQILLNVSDEMFQNIKIYQQLSPRSIEEMEEEQPVYGSIKFNFEMEEEVLSKDTLVSICRFLKFHLSPDNYYVFYQYFILERGFSEIAAKFQISRQSIEQRKRKIQKKCQQLLADEEAIFSETVKEYKKKYGDYYEKVGINPINPDSVILFSYINSSLTDEERYYFYHKYILQETYSDLEFCNQLGLTIDLFQKFEENLKEKCYGISFDEFEVYKRNMYETYKACVFDVLKEIPIIDLNQMKEQYQNFTYQDIVLKFPKSIDNLSRDHKNILIYYFNTCTNNVLPNKVYWLLKRLEEKERVQRKLA